MSLAEIGAWIAALGIALACALAYMRGNRGAALGGLLVAAAFSGLTARLGTAGVRLEQPAIVVLVALIALREPGLLASSVRRAWLPIALFLAFLGANVASALLFAPDVLQSLKVTLWLAISLTGGLVAMLLVVGPNSDAARTFHIWILGAAVASTAVAAGQVIAEVVFKSTWGLLVYDAPLAKASGLAWEPNLLSVYLAMASMFALLPPASVRLDPRWRWSSIVILAIGLALALSRGGVGALAVGFAIGVVLVAPGLDDRRSSLARLVAPGLLVLAIALAGYQALGWLGSRGVGLPLDQDASADQGPLPSLMPTTSTPPPAPGQTAGAPSGAPRPSPAASPSPHPSHAAIGISDDTVGIRVRNLLIAWNDGLQSPILGTGPDTFGQRYAEPTCDCPSHIPNQVSATFYETGFVGLLTLIAGFVLVVIGAVRAGRPDLAASLIVLAVGYQFTDAIRFATLWLLLGIALGVALLLADGRRPSWLAGRPEAASDHFDASADR